MLHESYLAALSGLGASQRRELARYYAVLDEEQRVYAHWQQRAVFKELLTSGKAPAGRGGEANYAALLLALQGIRDEEQRRCAGEAEPATAVRKPRKQPLRAALERRFMDRLIQLREQDQLSWRQIATYFKKQYRKQVSHTYLKKIYDQRQGEEQGR